MEDRHDFSEGRLYFGLVVALFIGLVALPVSSAAFHIDNSPDNNLADPFAAKKPIKSTQSPWISQNLVNDSEFSAGDFALSKWDPKIVQMGPYNSIELAEDYAEYASGSYMFLQTHDDVEETSFHEDLGESVGVCQELPETLYFANTKNITFEVTLSFRFMTTGGSGSLNLMTVASLQVGIDGQFKTLASVERSGTSHAAYDSGIQTAQYVFDMEERAYQNGYKTDFDLEIRIMAESVAYNQYISANIDNVYVYCDASDTYNPDFYEIDNKIKETSILKDSKFTRGYWDPTYGWAANIIESGGTTNGIELFRHADWVFYDKEYNYSEGGEVQSQKSKMVLQLTDNYGSGPDAYEKAYVEQTLPSYYFSNPSNFTFIVDLKYQLTISTKDHPELHNLQVGVEIGDEWVQDLQHSSNGVSAYDSGERHAIISYDMSDDVLSNSYSTAYPFRVVLKGSTAGGQVATLRIISVEVYCDSSLSQAPLLSRPADVSIEPAEAVEVS